MLPKFHNSNHHLTADLLLLPTVMGIQRGYRQNATDFFPKEEEWHASINISSGDFSENGLCSTHI